MDWFPRASRVYLCILCVSPATRAPRCPLWRLWTCVLWVACCSRALQKGDCGDDVADESDGSYSPRSLVLWMVYGSLLIGCGCLGCSAMCPMDSSEPQLFCVMTLLLAIIAGFISGIVVVGE